MDAGSTPASSTTFNALETEQNQAIAFDLKGCGFFASKSQLVSHGLDWAPKCHHSDTFQFDALNGNGTKEQFTQKEACYLLNSHVVRKEHEHNKNIKTSKVSYLAGLITLNDEIEVMVKFSNKLLQLNKFNFQRDISLIEMLKGKLCFPKR